MMLVWVRTVPQRTYPPGDPERMHADLRLDPDQTLRNLRSSPTQVWEEHYGCHRCQAILLAASRY